MILVECFTQAHIDNIAACLRLQPERVVFVGNQEEMAVPVARYEALFKERCPNTVVDTCQADQKDFDDLRKAILQLLLETEECVVDITGGEPTVALSIGAALADLDGEKRQKIRVERFEHDTGMVVDYSNGNRQSPAEPINLTVKEMIALHGGKVYADTFALPADATLKNIDRLWRVVSKMPDQWNDAIGILQRFEKDAEKNGNTIRVDLDALYAAVPNLKASEEIVRKLIEKLDREGVVSDQSSYKILQYTYRSAFLHYCVQKHGNALECKTLLEGKAVSRDGAPFFRDCQMSVHIDWDGVVSGSKYVFSGTNNEIDVLLIHDTTPLFISCKNGDIKTEELYKLHTVATRFGGPYARKMLLVSDMDKMEPTTARALTCRAWDMDIFMVPDVAELSGEQWQEIFRIPFSKDPEWAMGEFLKNL